MESNGLSRELFCIEAYFQPRWTAASRLRHRLFENTLRESDYFFGIKLSPAKQNE